MEFFSVIIPAHNCAATILRTLRSVVEAMDHFARAKGPAPEVTGEIIVVNDGSTDSTADRVAAFRHGRSDCQIIHRPTAGGPSSARNRGARQSRGDLLFFLDGDDLFLPPHIYECWRMLLNPAIDYVKTGVRLADPVHADWRPRLEFSLVGNLCVRRTFHEFVGGVPDFHLFARINDEMVHQLDIYYKMEDQYYNRLLEQLGRGAVVRAETMEYCRYPGNSYDVQYEKFTRPTGQVRDRRSSELPMQLADAIIEWRIQQLKRQRLATAGTAQRLDQARAAHQAGDVSRAAQLYREILVAEPDNGHVWYLLGVACGALGQLEEAAASLQQALRHDSDHAQTHNQLGVVLAQQARYDAAAVSFRQALALRPDLAEAHHNLGLARQMLGDRAGAVESFREALRLQPNFPAAQRSLHHALS